MAKDQFAICRTIKIKSWATLTKSVGHNLRTSADDRQHLAKVPEPLRILAGDPDWIDGWKADVNGMHLRRLAMGQTHTLARELFLGMSPEWAKTKTKKEIDTWAEANIAWLNERFGKERLKLAVLHLDEQTPHIAAYVVPLKADPKASERGSGWTLSDSSLGLGGNKAALSKLQDEYAEAMKSFGLRRGLKGAKATHQRTAQWKGQMAAPFDPPIVVPPIEKPTLSDRIDIEAYGKRVGNAAAKAVYQQMKPYRQQAVVQAKQLKTQGEELHKLRTMVEQLQPLADMLKALLEAVLGRPIALNTVKGQQEAMQAAKTMMATFGPRAEPPVAPSPPAEPAPRIDTSRSIRSPNRKPRAPRPGRGGGLSH
jgi:hypothetical protein